MRWIPILLAVSLLTVLAAAPVSAADGASPADASAWECDGVVLGGQFTGFCSEGDCTVGYINGTEFYWSGGCFP